MKGTYVCPHTKLTLNTELISKLNIIEVRIGKDLIITSGVRCPECNKADGGKPSSAHLTGEAVDIACPTGQERFTLLKNLLADGFNRLGIGSNFLHADISKTNPQNVIWTYY